MSSKLDSKELENNYKRYLGLLNEGKKKGAKNFIEKKITKTNANPEGYINTIREINAGNFIDSNDFRKNFGFVQEHFGEKVHFYLELIQNSADSNSTSIDFVIKEKEKKIIVKNDGNEFTSSDVASICDIGTSTKNYQNKIGYFGVGFKTVSRISESPEVHSGMYHFRFLKKSDCREIKKVYEKHADLVKSGEKMGLKGIDLVYMVLPEWIDRKDQVDGTKIILPTTKENIKKITEELNHFSGEILLFVRGDKKKGNPFKSVSINGRKHERKTGDSEYDYIIESSEGKRFWKVYSIQKEIGRELKKYLSEKKAGRGGKEVEEIVVAVELDENGHIKEGQNGKIFAFLPTETPTRFDFHIQGDFNVDPSRRYLNEPDGEWNQFILQNVVDSFRLLIEEFKGNNSPEFYKILPRADEERPEYLTVVKEKIDNEIKNTNSILTDAVKRGAKVWIKPGKAVAAKPEIKKLIPTKELTTFYKKRRYYVSNEIDGENWDYLSEVGVEELTVKKLIEKLDKNQKWIEKKIKNKQWHWFANLFICLAKEANELQYWSCAGKERIDSIKKKRLFPTVSGRVLSAEGGRKKLYQIPKKSDIPEELHRAFRGKFEILRPEVLESLLGLYGKTGDGKREIIGQAVKNLFGDAGVELLRKRYENRHDDNFYFYQGCWVKELEYRQIVRDFINPFFEGENFPERKAESYIDSVRSHEECWEIAELKLKSHRSAPKNPVYHKPTELYLSQAYGAAELETLLKEIKNIHFLSPHYIKTGENWKEFSTALGVKPYPKPEDIRERISNKSGLENQRRERGIDGEIRDSAPLHGVVRWNLVDYDFSTEIKDIINSCTSCGIKKDGARLKALLQLIDKNWDVYSKYLEAKYEWHSGYNVWHAEDFGLSSFAVFLKKEQWIPTGSGKLLIPSAAYLRKKKTLKDPAVKGEVIACELKNKKFIEFMGFQTEPSIGGSIENLKSLIARKEKEIEEYIDCYKSLNKSFKECDKILKNKKEDGEKISKIRWELGEGIDKLKNMETVFIPGLEKKYWKPSEVFWEQDKTLAFFKFKIGIAKYYSKHRLKDFFDRLEVEKKASVNDYTELLRLLWEKDRLDKEGVKKLNEMYRKINEGIKEES